MLLPTAPPVIVSASHDITVKTGASVELLCLVEGYPKPIVTWFKDGHSITPGPRISFHNESNYFYEIFLEYKNKIIFNYLKFEINYILKISRNNSSFGSCERWR